MFECSDILTYLNQFPTELLLHIFKFLSPKNLITCRQVCRRWKEVIDVVTNDENLWEEFCKRDFKTVYQDAKRKSNSCRLWFDVYKSLSLWGRLQEAKEVRDEFCHSSVVADEIQSMSILNNGVVSVHKRASIVYYDISTLEVSKRSPVYGEFTKYVEYDDALLILGKQSHLRIMKKKVKQIDSDSSESQLDEATFQDVIFFLRFGKIVYFTKHNSAISCCDLDNDLKAVHVQLPVNETIMSFSFYEGFLHVLTAEFSIFVYKQNMFVPLFSLVSKKRNLFDCLWRFQFIENIDWHMVYFWAMTFPVPIPEGPLRHICIMKVYGDLFFIGCNNGIFLIYYKPYVDGQLDLFKHNPVKRYRFAEREDIPVLSLHPVLQIDVAEIKGGHKILIAMPKKVIIITYNHSFEVTKSQAVVEYVPPGPVVLV